MNKDEINKAIAQACDYYVAQSEDCPNSFMIRHSREYLGFGWRDSEAEAWRDADNCFEDLDAIHKAVKELPDTFFIREDGFRWNLQCEFNVQLERIVFRESKKFECLFEVYNATAPHRCEAFLRTKNPARAKEIYG